MNRVEQQPHSPAILIVDDNPTNVKVVMHHLAEYGFQIMVARTGEAGLEVAQHDQPDLILLDLMLPGIDGFEVCRRLKADERTRQIPVIFMTVLTKVEDKVKGFEVGGVDYIAKPFQAQEVLARVTTHLRLRNLTRELREARDTLEDRVEARTAELARANQELQSEIAERKRIEEELKKHRAHLEDLVRERTAELILAKEKALEAQRAAEAANQAKSAFLAHMSHELRTPLNGILGYADILKRRVDAAGPFTDGLDIIQRSGEHLLTLINDVLDLAKVEAGKLELNPAPFHLPTFLRQIVDIVRARAEAKDLALAYEALSPLPETVVTDETRLRQVLLNLLGNAVKFTEQGEVVLSVRVGEEGSMGVGEYGKYGSMGVGG